MLRRPNDIPETPGVYRFVAGDNRTLYVGKARNLKNRLDSYFTHLAGLSTSADASRRHNRTGRMLLEAESLDWTVCSSASEALLLESSWIVQHQPPYNVRLRHGDNYPGLALSRDEPARLFLWRRRRPENAETFGPYPAGNGRDLLDALTTVFPVRTCDQATYKKACHEQRVCLLGEINRCSGPCVGNVSEHRTLVQQLQRHLRKPDPELLDTLNASMLEHARAERFEAAGIVRDQIRALSTLLEHRRIDGHSGNGRFVAVVRDGERSAVCDLVVVSGTIEKIELWTSVDDPGLDSVEMLEQILLQLTNEPAAITLVETSRSKRARGQGEKNMLSFAASQAKEHLRRTSGGFDPAADRRALESLTRLLGGNVRTIECVDVSHFAGVDTVGAIVTLVDGEPVRQANRKVHLGDVNDDPESIRRTVSRRFTGRKMGRSELPDLLLVDGGAQQVQAARDALHQAALSPRNDPDTPGGGPLLVGISKTFEELWLPGDDRPRRLPGDEPALKLLQRARDNAHQLAIGSQRTRRERAPRTRLETVRGLGPKKRRNLLLHFGSIDAVRNASVSDLKQVPGIGDALARSIAQHLSDGSET